MERLRTYKGTTGKAFIQLCRGRFSQRFEPSMVIVRTRQNFFVVYLFNYTVYTWYRRVQLIESEFQKLRQAIPTYDLPSFLLLDSGESRPQVSIHDALFHL
ncbi:hypothetical protein KP509_10G042500 [Ceratopteris richardii]|uniref:Uncharacterized protein n=1 Tax=Ceratopteris richardii TaxID=49495 RepID=A0A8T2TYC4_CERRI|nr:hypothetical protein KP509_10G042500 [Ceratopteris richardii]